MLSYHSFTTFISSNWHKLIGNSRISRLLLVVMMLFIAGLVLVGFKNRFHSFYFQDETDHVSMGWMMWRFDKELYQDLSVNHMPIPVYLGAFLTRLITFNSMYQLVAALRESMWLLWTLFALFAVWRFRSAGAVTFTFLLLLNFYYFGFHVLTDPIGAMSIAIMTLYLVFGIFQKQTLSLTDGVIFGLLSAVAWFSLLAVWPFVLGAWLLMLWGQTKHFRIGTILGILAIVILIFSFITPANWWRETVVNNVVYVMKDQSNFTTEEKIGLVIFPLTVLTQPSSQQAMLIFGLFLLFIWVWWQWWHHSLESNKYKLSISALVAILVISLNTRVPHSMYVFYRGIHALPYLAALTGLIGGLLFLIRPYLSRAQKIAVYSLTLFLIVFTGRFMYENINQMTEYYVQYGEYESTGVALGRLKNSGETLMTGPDGYGFINQIADLPIFGKQNFHLSWSFQVPYLHDYFFTQFAQNPPTYVFVRPGGDPHYQAILPQLKTDYVRLKRQTSTQDIEMYELYMRKSEINQHSFSQWKAFQDVGFNIPKEFTM